MDKIIDLIATNSPASEISNSIKDAIFAKAAERIDAMKPMIAQTMFNDAETQEEE